MLAFIPSAPALAGRCACSMCGEEGYHMCGDRKERVCSMYEKERQLYVWTERKRDLQYGRSMTDMNYITFGEKGMWKC